MPPPGGIFIVGGRKLLCDPNKAEARIAQAMAGFFGFRFRLVRETSCDAPIHSGRYVVEEAGESAATADKFCEKQETGQNLILENEFMGQAYCGAACKDKAALHRCSACVRFAGPGLLIHKRN
jgi:hypothetical protein